MSRPEDLAERIERLVLRHEELKRTNALLTQQLGSVSHERDSLRSRLAAARARIDALLDRLPAEAVTAPRAAAPARLPITAAGTDGNTDTDTDTDTNAA